MSYRVEITSNNVELQSVLDYIRTMGDSSDITPTFVPTDSGSLRNKDILSDNNIDLQTILEMIYTLPEKPSGPLLDFVYEIDNQGRYILTGWRGTLNGVDSTSLVIPDTNEITIVL